MAISRQVANRPFKFGANDRREFIVQDSEVTLRAINDTSGNPVYLGRALVNSATSDTVWQIRKVSYDSADGVTSVLWPQNDQSNASNNFEFAWSAVSDLTVTNITQANPAAVTVSAAGSLSNGDTIVLQDVEGMTEVNFDGTNEYTVANLVGTTFELQGIDSTGFTAYSAGGTVTYGNMLQLTYS